MNEYSFGVLFFLVNSTLTPSTKTVVSAVVVRYKVYFSANFVSKAPDHRTLLVLMGKELELTFTLLTALINVVKLLSEKYSTERPAPDGVFGLSNK